MARPNRASGVTLIEAMVAMSVLVVGSLGLLGLHRVGVIMNADARVMTRATAIAQDLVSQMALWDYVHDPRLVNMDTSNDSDFADSSGSFETATFKYDHAEGELETQGNPYTWLGMPTATVQGLGFTRYWNVAEVDFDANGALNAKRVAVIVRWERNGVARRIVLITALRNPAITN
jgi:Prokaryotic N-terminal methylation motif